MEKSGCSLSVEEEIVSKWVPAIRRALMHYRVFGSDQDDMVQEIVGQVLEGNYAKIYDPKKSELSTFIFAMVRKRVYSLRSRKGRDAMKKSQLIGDEDWIFDVGPVSECVLEALERAEFWRLVDKARAELDKLPRRRARVVDGGLEHRSARDVFELLIDGYNQAAIAEIMGYSEGTVTVLKKIIRKQPAVQKLLVYHNL